MSSTSAQALLSYLEQHNDTLYHAGRLISGEAYVVTDKHRVYYGWPNSLEPLNMAHWITNRCIDYQIREYTAKNGIKIRVTTQDNHRSAQFRAPLPGSHLPIPQIKQASFFGDTPEPLEGRARTARDL